MRLGLTIFIALSFLLKGNIALLCLLPCPYGATSSLFGCSKVERIWESFLKSSLGHM